MKNFANYLFSLTCWGFCLTSIALYGNTKLCHKTIQINQSNDLTLDYSQIAIEDLFQPFLPDLSNVSGQYNTFFSPKLAVNPTNHQNIVTLYTQDAFKEINSPKEFAGLLTNSGPQIAFSNNAGKTWSYSLSALPTWLSKYGLSQVVINANLSFSKKGTLFVEGIFNSTNTLNPNVSMGGIFVTKSTDGGETWSYPITLDLVNTSLINISSGFGDSAAPGSILSDLIDPDLVHVSWSKIDFSRGTLYGNIWYSRSKNESRSWEPARLIYDMANDSTWVAQHGYTNLNVNPPIFLGGQSFGGGLAEILPNPKQGRYSNGVLLEGFIRFYPQQGALTYTQDASDTLFDHAIIRSFDQGKTWTEKAIEVGQYVFAFSHNPTQPGVFSIIANDGGVQNVLVASPKTGRVYYAWQGGNIAISLDPEVNQFFPVIQMASSADAGETWSPIVNVSRTPFNSTIQGANQSFNPNMAIAKNGLVGIIYTDFRNYDGSSTIVNADNWLAIYKETKSPKGGSTGIGLDFVKEIRLTPQSFNALIGLESNVNGIGVSNGIAVAGKEFLTAFPVTNQGNLPPNLGPDGMTQDLNNRINIFFEKICFGKKKK